MQADEIMALLVLATARVLVQPITIDQGYVADFVCSKLQYALEMVNFFEQNVDRVRGYYVR
jgi:hypothetical protein